MELVMNVRREYCTTVDLMIGWRWVESVLWLSDVEIVHSRSDLVIKLFNSCQVWRLFSGL